MLLTFAYLVSSTLMEVGNWSPVTSLAGSARCLVSQAVFECQLDERMPEVVEADALRASRARMLRGPWRTSQAKNGGSST
jgi:hypothetical protein